MTDKKHSGPQTKETEIIKAARPELNGQEFRNVIHQGAALERYKVAKDGLVMSYARYKEGRPLEWTGIGTKGYLYPGVKMRLPADILSYADKTADNYRESTNTIGRTIKVHKLVADTWADNNDNCPEELEPWWDAFPVELKKILKSYFLLDHIDDNKLNPHISNLRFVSNIDNHKLHKANSQNPKTVLDMALKI